MFSKRKALKRLGIFILAELLLVMIVTIIFDPFYQYHAPWFGQKQVLYDRDNQVVGTIRTNAYDSILLGSSVAENFDSSYLDELYDCHTLKVIRASGSTADLLYYMEKAHSRQDIRRVFWCMDIFSLTASTEVTLYGNDTPRYLHTDSILDDVTYLFNKDILFMKIPQMFAYSMLDINTGGHAYDWSAGKTFGAEKAMQAYAKPKEVQENVPTPQFAEKLAENIMLMNTELESHPDTKYTIIFPPYSMLWWDCGYVNGIGEEYFTVLETVLPALLSHSNAEVYYFQNEKEIICNLDNYMDMIHYSPDINQYMLTCIAEGSHRVTAENCEQTIEDMKKTYDYIIQEGIYLYYDK